MQYPSNGLPEHLSTKEYYELGLQYRLAGWVGLAREALSLVIDTDETGNYSKKASKVLKTQLPLKPVPVEAEQKNIQGYNLMLTNPKEAKELFKDLMNNYPDFEWPFSNTAKLKLQEGDIAGARGLAKYLLQVNPHLLSAIDLMIKISIIEERYDDAMSYLDKALELYPHEEEFKQLKLALKIQTKGKPPDEIPPDLTGRELYELGIELQAVGRLEESRTILSNCLDVSESEELKEKARLFIKTQLPKNSVPPRAEEKCIEAFKTMNADIEKSKNDLLKLTMEYPDFEWPFMFLGTMYITEGANKKAEKMIRRVVSNNPDLIMAKHLLITILLADGKFNDALEFIDKFVERAETDNDGLALDLLRAQCQLLEKQSK